jgi:ATP-dependent Clp protease adaptor protein ClpS
LNIEKAKPVYDITEKSSELKDLILYNDDFNTFDYVIETLIEVCGHDTHQAEQCALIAHIKGKCPVKSGTFFDLKPPYEEMTQRNLTVEIQ